MSVRTSKTCMSRASNSGAWLRGVPASLRDVTSLQRIIHSKRNTLDYYSNEAAFVTLWRAQNAVCQLLEQCQKHDRFDFGKYFQEEKKDFFPIPEEWEEDDFNEALAYNHDFVSSQEKDKDCFPLTEKAVQASSELRPYYYAYAERRAIARLQSHRSSLFSGRQRQDGEFLPALPMEIEARIRSLALLSAENPILATRIPDPIAHDSD